MVLMRRQMLNWHLNKYIIQNCGKCYEGKEEGNVGEDDGVESERTDFDREVWEDLLSK